LISKLVIWFKRHFVRYYAKCMGCGKVHEHYRLTSVQTCYILWCDNCGTRMHDHGLKIGFRQRIREMQDISFCDCFTPDKFSNVRRH
jgi:hypothetical protein